MCSVDVIGEVVDVEVSASGTATEAVLLVVEPTPAWLLPRA